MIYLANLIELIKLNRKLKKYISKYILYVWIAFFLFPIFTGLFHFNTLPNENPLDDLSLYEILEYHEDVIGPTGAEIAMHPTLWRNKSTGEIFSDEDFIEHHRKEIWRITKTMVLYGFLGCIIFAIGYKATGKGKFVVGMQYALVVNAAIAVGFYLLFI
jgi:hypothetical protein